MLKVILHFLISQFLLYVATPSVKLTHSMKNEQKTQVNLLGSKQNTYITYVNKMLQKI